MLRTRNDVTTPNPWEMNIFLGSYCVIFESIQSTVMSSLRSSRVISCCNHPRSSQGGSPNVKQMSSSRSKFQPPIKRFNPATDVWWYSRYLEFVPNLGMKQPVPGELNYMLQHTNALRQSIAHPCAILCYDQIWSVISMGPFLKSTWSICWLVLRLRHGLSVAIN